MTVTARLTQVAQLSFTPYAFEIQFIIQSTYDSTSGPGKAAKLPTGLAILSRRDTSRARALRASRHSALLPGRERTWFPDEASWKKPHSRGGFPIPETNPHEMRPDH